MEMPLKALLFFDSHDLNSLAIVVDRLRRRDFDIACVHARRPDSHLLKLVQPDVVVCESYSSGIEVRADSKCDERRKMTAVLTFQIRNTNVGELNRVESSFPISDHAALEDFLLKARLMLSASAMHAGTSDGIKFPRVTLSFSRREIRVDGTVTVLSATEMNLFAVIIRADGTPVQRRQLIESAGVGQFTTDRTIDVHIYNLRRKLGSARELIRVVRGVGYALDLLFANLEILDRPIHFHEINE